MQVGICTKYTHSEPTYAAIRLATELATQGAEVSLYNPWSLRELIDRNWDEHVLSAKVARFTDWARYQQCLIWTTVPHCEQLDWAKQNKIAVSKLMIPLSYAAVLSGVVTMIGNVRLAAALTVTSTRSLPLPRSFSSLMEDFARSA